MLILLLIMYRKLFRTFFSIALILYVICPGSTFAQDDFFYVDYALFRAADNKTIIELYYSFDQNKLKFIKSETGFEATGSIELLIDNVYSKKNGIDQTFKIPVTVNDTAGYNRNNRLSGQLNMLLDSGNYRLNIKAYDHNDPEVSAVDTASFKLGRFTNSRITSSSIQLANNITKSDDANSIFYKNNLEVEPNPSRLYGNNISKLYYYIEFYNLTEDFLKENYKIGAYIFNSDNKIIKENEREYKRKIADKVEIGSIDINDLSSGPYMLTITLSDNSNPAIINISKRFYIYNSGIVDSNTSTTDLNNAYLLSDIAKMTRDQLMDEFKKSRYLMTDDIEDKFEKFDDLETQKQFYFTFWKGFDQTPNTPNNEFKKEYFGRVAYANKHYKTDTRSGWESDRGRVYVLYGKPSETERYPFESNSKGYEIWRYELLEGGVEFVFVDLINDGRTYELVHSTKRNEMRDDNWRRRLSVQH